MNITTDEGRAGPGACPPFQVFGFRETAGRACRRAGRCGDDVWTSISIERVPARLRDNVKLVHNVCGANRLRVASLSTGSGPWLIIFDPFRVESVLLNLSALTHRLSMTARRMPVSVLLTRNRPRPVHVPIAIG